MNVLLPIFLYPVRLVCSYEKEISYGNECFYDSIPGLHQREEVAVYANISNSYWDIFVLPRISALLLFRDEATACI